jgi:hypothetical protein
MLAAWIGVEAQAPTPLPNGLRRWTLSTQPTLRIGTEGDSASEFERIVGVIRMPTGELVVANSGTAELRVFTPTGKFLRSLSREGEGPGELGNLGRVFRAGDTLFVAEFAGATTVLHVFTVREGYRSRFTPRPPDAPRGPSPVARLGNGDFLVSEAGFIALEPVANVIIRDTMRMGIMDPAGVRPVRWLGGFPNLSFLGYLNPTMRNGVGFTRFTLGPSLVTAASGNRTWIGDTGTGSIAIHEAGRLVGTIELPVRRRPFSVPALERAKQRALDSASTPDQKLRYESLYDRRHRPSTAPLFTRFIAAPDGQLVVELFEEEGRVVPRSHIVLDRDGKAVAGFVVPANVVLHEIGTDYALGVQTDDDGVERVVQYALRR